MDAPSEIREFLSSRRARITPEAAGLPVYGGANRRVKGLRREEVAMLAGVSVDYYTQLERGRLGGVSDQVLAALGQALQLDEAELAHLHNLASTANASPSTRRQRTPAAVRPPVQRMLDAMVDAPAWVRNDRFDLLAGNALGRALYAPVLAMRGTLNTARFAFLEPGARTFFRDWERTVDDCVATLRGSAGRNPYDKGLIDLVGELSTRSPEFRTRWASHDVRFHRTGIKRLHHPGGRRPRPHLRGSRAARRLRSDDAGLRRGNPTPPAPTLSGCSAPSPPPPSLTIPPASRSSDRDVQTQVVA